MARQGSGSRRGFVQRGSVEKTPRGPPRGAPAVRCRARHRHGDTSRRRAGCARYRRTRAQRCRRHLPATSTALLLSLPPPAPIRVHAPSRLHRSATRACAREHLARPPAPEDPRTTAASRCCARARAARPRPRTHRARSRGRRPRWLGPARPGSLVLRPAGRIAHPLSSRRCVPRSRDAGRRRARGASLASVPCHASFSAPTWRADARAPRSRRGFRGASRLRSLLDEARAAPLLPMAELRGASFARAAMPAADLRGPASGRERRRRRSTTRTWAAQISRAPAWMARWSLLVRRACAVGRLTPRDGRAVARARRSAVEGPASTRRLDEARLAGAHAPAASFVRSLHAGRTCAGSTHATPASATPTCGSRTAPRGSPWRRSGGAHVSWPSCAWRHAGARIGAALRDRRVDPGCPIR